ncbi:MAG: fasciclin domain-containing protein [Pseudomonadota bacterium]
MQSLVRHLRLVALALLSAALLTVPAKAQHPTLNIVETAVASDDFNLLVATLEATGLDAALADEHANFTVFAPTDAAFKALGKDTIIALLDDTETLSDILLYHVLDRKKSARQLERRNGRTVKALNGDRIDVSVVGHDLFLNDSEVIVRNIRTTNGIIHVIDQVLIPPEEVPGPTLNIVETAVEAGSFTTLVAALEATGLDQALANPDGTFTVFAPTDAAFDALGADTIGALLNDPDTLSDILLYHVLGSERPSSNLLRRSSRSLRALNHDRVITNITDEGLYINQSLVVAQDIQTSNGIIHVIDRVLLPITDEVVDGTIVDVAVEAGSFTTLVTALQATGLDHVLANPHYRFTVFAPTDAAFEALGQDTINELLANPRALTDVLLYHVSAWPKKSDRVLRSTVRGIRMLNWDRVNVGLEEGEIFINDAQIIVKDIVTQNGVIHVIDAVLVPPSH